MPSLTSIVSSSALCSPNAMVALVLLMALFMSLGRISNAANVAGDMFTTISASCSPLSITLSMPSMR